MATTISPDEYCKHPEDYQNASWLDNQTRAYWDQYCQLQKQAASQGSGGYDRQGLAQAIPSALLNFVSMFFEPSNLAILSIIKGGPIGYKAIKSIIGKATKLSLTDAEQKLAAEAIEAGGDAYLVNSGTLFSKIFGDIVYLDLEIAEKAGYSAGKMAIAELLDSAEMLGIEFLAAASEIMDALLVLQLMGMVFDAWDPCKLNVMLTGKMLKEFSDNFNNQFRRSVLASVASTVDSYGHISYSTNWPVEYYAEQGALTPFKNDVYEPIRQKLYLQYLCSLQYNSNGEPIYHGRKGEGRALTNNDLSAMQTSLLKLFGNSNTVAENWILKWWPMLLGIVILIVLVVLMVRRKN